MTVGSSRFEATAASTPMLSRVADSMYWMSRYVERSEHVARILLVHSHLLTDVADLDATLELQLWRGVLRIMGVEQWPEGGLAPAQAVARHMTFGAGNPNSILACITNARENARAIRENLSSEMWESLNSLYWMLRADDVQHRFDESPHELFRQVALASLLFQGLTDETLSHGQGWQFARLGRYLERVDATCRILNEKYSQLRAAETVLDAPLRNIHWMAVLRSCGALDAYRRAHPGDLAPSRMAGFLLLEPRFPRTVKYGVRQAYESSAAIRGGTTPHLIDPAERILGRLDAQLEYVERDEITAAGLPSFLAGILGDVAEVAAALQRRYFLSRV